MALNAGRPRRITVLGSTGSVGKSTVALLDAAAEGEFDIVALVAGRDWQGLAAQARRLRARHAVLADPAQYAKLKEALAGTDTQVAAGPEAVIAAASLPADWTMAAIVGAAGLPATMAALARGGVLAIANKETLVCAAEPVLAMARTGGATILPVDSEHNAIFQALDTRDPSAIAKIILTASGGPCRNMSMQEMAAVTPEVAVRHPVWSMGAKISVDSATMFNKGLELIEAARLFPVPESRIDVLVHPQSTVHGLVQYTDGSVLAQLGTPDMRTPIAHALAWPARMDPGNRHTVRMPVHSHQNPRCCKKIRHTASRRMAGRAGSDCRLEHAHPRGYTTAGRDAIRQSASPPPCQAGNCERSARRWYTNHHRVAGAMNHCRFPACWWVVHL